MIKGDEHKPELSTLKKLYLAVPDYENGSLKFDEAWGFTTKLYGRETVFYFFPNHAMPTRDERDVWKPSKKKAMKAYLERATKDLDAAEDDRDYAKNRIKAATKAMRRRS